MGGGGGCVFFFFKQKTAYEIYQCDWSSDVCSSDLIMEQDSNLAGEKAWLITILYDFESVGVKGLNAFINHVQAWVPDDGSFFSPAQKEVDLSIGYEIGRASCRERV